MGTRCVSAGAIVAALVAAALPIAAVQPAAAAPGDIDGTFGGGVVTVEAGTDWAFARDVALLGNGSVLLAGGIAEPGGSPSFGIVRLTATGELDTTFGTGGAATTVFPDSQSAVEEVEVLPDGRILAVGQVQGTVGVARYAADGAADTSYGGGDGNVISDWDFEAFEVLDGTVMADGSLLAAAYGFPGQVTFHRFTAAGAPDPSFGTGGVVATELRGPSGRLATPCLGEVLSDGTTIAIAVSSTLSGFEHIAARFTPAGALDTTFGGGDGIASIAGSRRRRTVRTMTAPWQRAPIGASWRLSTTVRKRRSSRSGATA